MGVIVPRYQIKYVSFSERGRSCLLSKGIGGRGLVALVFTANSNSQGMGWLHRTRNRATIQAKKGREKGVGGEREGWRPFQSDIGVGSVSSPLDKEGISIGLPRREKGGDRTNDAKRASSRDTQGTFSARCSSGKRVLEIGQISRNAIAWMFKWTINAVSPCPPAKSALRNRRRGRPVFSFSSSFVERRVFSLVGDFSVWYSESI